MKRKITGCSELVSTWSDGNEEPKIARQLLVGLRYHVRTQYLLSSRRAKQRIIIGIAIAAVVLTLIFSIR